MAEAEAIRPRYNAKLIGPTVRIVAGYIGCCVEAHVMVIDFFCKLFHFMF